MSHEINQFVRLIDSQGVTQIFNLPVTEVSHNINFNAHVSHSALIQSELCTCNRQNQLVNQTSIQSLSRSVIQSVIKPIPHSSTFLTRPYCHKFHSIVQSVRHRILSFAHLLSRPISVNVVHHIQFVSSLLSNSFTQPPSSVN